MVHQRVLVVDFGGQYSQLIVRRVRELGVYSEMVPWTEVRSAICSNPPDAVILSGGPRSVFDSDAPNLDFSVLEGIPVLGICYGHQLIAANLGGEVQAAGHKEYGLRTVETSPNSLVGNLESDQVWMSHGTQAIKAPPGFVVTARTPSCEIAAFEDTVNRRYGVQFHPEVSHTPAGRTILKRFLFDVCRLKADWTSQGFIEEEVERIRQTVGSEGKVLCAVSGGVDSSVMAALLIKAIGDRAVRVFVDHGLLRKDEARQVEETFLGHFKANLKVF